MTMPSSNGFTAPVTPPGSAEVHAAAFALSQREAAQEAASRGIRPPCAAWEIRFFFLAFALVIRI